jgi:glycosyltransferase involved in cell wall biosynthesis
LLSFSGNVGKESALTAGLEHSSGDVVIMLDSDFQQLLEMMMRYFFNTENQSIHMVKFFVLQK